MVHPAGTALFGEYQISNNFNIGAALQSLVRILAISLKDSALMLDTGDTPGGLQFNISKALTESTLMSESLAFAIGTSLSDSLTTPTDATTNAVGKALADSLTTPTDATTNAVGKALADSLNTPTDAATFFVTTSLADSFGLVDNSTIISNSGTTIFTTKYVTDTENMSSADDGYVAINPYSQGGYFSIHPIIYDNTVDSKFGSTVDTNPQT
jgi:hypothetical protein